MFRIHPCQGRRRIRHRIDRRFYRDIRNFAFATMGMILATTTPIWVTLLLTPTG